MGGSIVVIKNYEAVDVKKFMRLVLAVTRLATPVHIKCGITRSEGFACTEN